MIFSHTKHKNTHQIKSKMGEKAKMHTVWRLAASLDKRLVSAPTEFLWSSYQPHSCLSIASNVIELLKCEIIFDVRQIPVIFVQK